ncbi:MAG TPA: DUF4395 domain-containing protein [Acidimicrobiales bacterium]|nr:DUF4395 domain-containing protein [Acidimicrobiales bacterium]
MSRVFSFPNPVNEVSARLVAGGVVLMSLATLLFDQPLLLVPIAYGFVARVLAGPRFSPLALLVTEVITPRLAIPERLVPGPPKRFAQGMGAAMSVTAAVLALGFGNHGAAYALLAALIAAATLEAVFAICLGCQIFSLLMRAGIIPEEICAECNDIWSRRRVGASAP